MGIAPTHAVTYTNDSAGVRANYESVTYAVSAMRAQMPLPQNWKSAVEEDQNRRKK